MKRIKKYLNKIRPHIKLTPISGMLAVNLVLVFLQLLYINLRFKYLTVEIPLFYTNPWGPRQLTSQNNIFIIPAMGLLTTTLGSLFLVATNKKYFKYSSSIITGGVTLANVLLSYAVIRIIQISSTPFKPLINPTLLSLIIPFVFCVIFVYLVAPSFIRFAQEKGLITDPKSHRHPAMILTQPSARGGGILFTICLIISTIIFVPLTKEITGMLTIAALIAVLGFLDDYQNTHPKSKLRLLEKPYIRLILLISTVTLLTKFGIKIDFVNNPFNGVLELNTLLSAVVTTVWIVWILNLLSWSNGIDGQYSGIIGIVGIVIAFLALRFKPLEPSHLAYAKVAVISAGIGFGLTSVTWHPSKIMWGFGAMSAGLVIAALSILVNAKITSSILILLIPFLDAFITLTRRVLQGKNPLKGDRGHLHHLLLDRGWTVPQIALFYWGTTLLFGIIGILSAEKLTLQTTLTFAGIAAFFIILMNVKSLATKRQQPKAE